MMNFRALELHGKSFWDHAKIERALDFVRAYDLTALVIHESDMMTEFFFPTEFFDPGAPWDGAPARRGENALHNNMAYLRDILKRAARKRVEVWIEVKEITFPDEIVERNPGVLKNGRICPTDPLWLDVVRAKYRDLVGLFPGIRGVVVSAGSPEGKAALSQKKCSCERCASTKLTDWYASIVEAMHGVLSPAGVGLAVREFSYNANHQAAITEAMSRMPKDVVYCIKVTPHDFYPTFPDNGLVERVKDRPKWIEYDTMGQYYGWGVLPCFMREDIASRFAYAMENGAEGALLRVEWERINDHWSLDGLGRLNLLAAADCARGSLRSPEEAIERWLEEEGIVRSAADVRLLGDYLRDTWGIFRRALYVHDFVLNDSSMVPLSIERAWWSMAEKHSLAEWFPERKADLDLDEAKVTAYLAEKDEAVSLIEAWRKKVEAIDASTPVIDLLKRAVAETARYVGLHRAYGRVCILASYADLKGPSVPEGRIRELEDACDELEAYAASVRRWLEESDYRHQMYLLFNPDRCAVLVEGGRSRAEAARTPGEGRPT